MAYRREFGSVVGSYCSTQKTIFRLLGDDRTTPLQYDITTPFADATVSRDDAESPTCWSLTGDIPVLFA
jgi:hypothetical protein